MVNPHLTELFKLVQLRPGSTLNGGLPPVTWITRITHPLCRQQTLNVV